VDNPDFEISRGAIMTSQKYIYAFEEGDGKNKILLGGKGAGLCEMTQIGLNVPRASLSAPKHALPTSKRTSCRTA
jgi:hypothetical protein